jgi:hypothetical protein
VIGRRFHAYGFSTASDEITWKKPRSITIVIAWSITSASIILNAFLGGIEATEWYVLLILFFMSIFAGMLLEDIKAIILGVFEALFLTLFLTYVGIILPALLGRVSGFYQANVAYMVSADVVFRTFFPLGILSLIMGGLVGGFVKDWLF